MAREVSFFSYGGSSTVFLLIFKEKTDFLKLFLNNSGFNLFL